MPRIMTLFFPFLIIGGMTAYGQQPRDAAQAPSKDSAPEKAKPLKVTGTVKAYEEGKRIQVEAKGAQHTYDLTSSDATYMVSPDVAVGSKVKLTERTDSTGRKTVTIEPAGKSDKPASEKPNRPMSEKPPIAVPPIR